MRFFNPELTTCKPESHNVTVGVADGVQGAQETYRDKKVLAKI
jgi:hypothetical protein